MATSTLKWCFVVGDIVLVTKPADVSDPPGWFDDSYDGKLCTVSAMVPGFSKFVKLDGAIPYFNEDWCSLHQSVANIKFRQSINMLNNAIPLLEPTAPKAEFEGFCDTGPGGGPGGCGGQGKHRIGCPTAKALVGE